MRSVVLSGLTIAAAIAAVVALPSDIPADGSELQPTGKTSQVDANEMRDFDKAFDDMYTAKKLPSAQAALMQVADSDTGVKAFENAFAELDHAAAKYARSKNRHPSLNPHTMSLQGGPYEDFAKHLNHPPSTPISDINPSTAAALKTNKRTAATTSLAFEKYKHSPFALKVVGKDKKAKLQLTNPKAFKKMVEAIKKGLAKLNAVVGPKKGGVLGGIINDVGLTGEAKQTILEAWACSDQGKLMKKVYDDAMGFWNGQGHEIYGKLCSTTGGRCAASKKIILPFNFKGVANEPIPSEVTTTWWAHKMDCSPMMKQITAALHSGAHNVAAPSALLCVIISMFLWNMHHFA